ncbi:uncharacterized protein LOC143628470 [Bidens hawaiensis]|uniref:uncharacterized protein LOC143628470 n=1 Tax=Bidens hawaiensis TaxID=980011 RepID=UPI0040493E82
MVTEGIMLGHKISRDGIEVDQAKIDTISRLPPLTNVKAIRSFLGVAGFHRRFIKDFSKVTRPMTRLLEKDVPFVFDDECLKAFTFLKEKLIGGDWILRRCVTKEKGWDILKHVHGGLTRGHHDAHATAQKVFDSGFYWPTVVKDAEEFMKLCDVCQRTGVKRILERTVGVSRKDWSEKLDDALWVFRTAYKTPLGTTPFMLVYGKSSHLPVELEHRAYWALKTVNVDLTEAARKRYFQIHELEELRDAAYSRSLNIKEKTKALHDRRLKGEKEFKKGDKLRSKWTGPYLVKEVFPYGVVELENPDNGTSWKVNGHRLKHYLGGPNESIEVEETPLNPSH